MRFFSYLPALALSLATLPAWSASSCGGNFNAFVKDLKAEAVAMGHAPDSVDSFFASVRQDNAVLKADRAQGVFQKPFTDFAQHLISSGRIKTGRSKAKQYSAVFDRIEAEYGVSRGVLLAFWAFETDYGGFQGNFNTLNALVTLSHDCRRPELFRPQVFAHWNFTRWAISIPPPPPVPGRVRLAWCRCCPATSSKTGWTATATDMSA